MRLIKWLYKHYTESRFFKWAANSGLLAAIAPTVHLVLTLIAAWHDSERVYSGSLATQMGESRCEFLPEASRLCLDSFSQARYRFNGATRNVEILRGRISLVVHKDSRPFDVLAGGALIHDVGTGFLIDKESDSIKVVVTEGRVRAIAPVDPEVRSQFALGQPESAWKTAPELRKFQQAEFDEITRTWHSLPELNKRGLSRLLAWEDGRIELAGRTVSESVKELARYQTLPTFKCTPAVGQVQLAGDLTFNDLEGFLQALDSEFGIHHAVSGKGATKVIILYRQRAKSGENIPHC